MGRRKVRGIICVGAALFIFAIAATHAEHSGTYTGPLGETETVRSRCMGETTCADGGERIECDGGGVERRYLLYSVNPLEGFNLARDVFGRAVTLVLKLQELQNERDQSLQAQCHDKGGTQWVLVLPPFVNHHWRIGHARMGWGDVFDVDYMKATIGQGIDVIELSEFMASTRPSAPQIDHILYLTLQMGLFEGGRRVGVFKDTTPNCTFRNGEGRYFIQDGSSGEWFGGFWFYSRDEMRGKRLSCLDVLGMSDILAPHILDLPEHPTSVLASFLDATMSLHHTSEEYWRIRSSMRFSSMVEREASAVIEMLMGASESDGDTPFLAVHMRRGDFLTVRDVPSVDDTFHQIVETLGFLGWRDVYIASDARSTDADFESFMNRDWGGVKVHIFSHNTTKRTHPGVAAVVDQVICARAGYFIGTEASTFTSRIIEERQLRGKDDSTTHHYLQKRSEAGFDMKASIRFKLVGAYSYPQH